MKKNMFIGGILSGQIGGTYPICKVYVKAM